MTAKRVGIVGFGVWPRQAYLPILREMSDVDVVAVAARSAATRDFARQTLGASVTLHEDYRKLLADDGVDAVMLALPNALHLDALEAAANSGKHIFLEPPVGLNADDVGQAIGVLDRCTQIVQADLELRYMPIIDAVRGLLDEGVLGELLTAKIRLRCDWGQGGAARKPDIERQGFFFWLGCWYLDVLDVVFGAAPMDAAVSGGRAMNGRLMDHGWATMRYPADRLGQFEFSLVAVDDAAVTLEVAGTKGEMEADLLAGTCRWTQQGGSWQQSVAPCSEPVCGFAGMRECIAAFFKSINEGTPSRAGADVCRRVHHAALLCTEADR